MSDPDRKILQRRIRNQRKALREQHKTLRLYSHLISELTLKQETQRANAYRHAAILAESRKWSFGWQIARTIRHWL